MLGDISSLMHPSCTSSCTLPLRIFPSHFHTYLPSWPGLTGHPYGTSLRKVADGVTGHDGWVSTNGRWH